MPAMSDILRLPAPRLTPRTVGRAIIAGTAWGALFTITMTAVAWSACGGICLDDVALTAVVSVTAGIITIGPLTAFGR